MGLKNSLLAALALAFCAAGSAALAQGEAAAEPAEGGNSPEAQSPTIAVDGPAESPEAPEEAASHSRLAEEIVVTAQKREERLQDVPISISAFSGAALDAKGVNDAKALAQSVPGVTYGEQVNFSIIYIRGVGTDAYLPDSDPSVATYMDGIYFPFANGLTQALGAVQRVEVLKGPQGTLFGRNATGGAFNILSRPPSLTSPELSLSTGYTDEIDQFGSRVYANVPLADSLAINVSGVYNAGKEYYDGTVGEHSLPHTNERGVRVRALWQPADWMDLTLTGVRHKKQGVASTAMPNHMPSLLMKSYYLTTMGRPYEIPDDYHVDVDVPGYFTLDNKVAYAQLALHPAWFDVKMLGSSQHIVTDNDFDFDGTDAPLIRFDAKGQYAKVKTGELQFISNGESGPAWLEWVGGLYYLKQEVGFPLNRLATAGLDLSDGLLVGVPIPAGILAGYRSVSDSLQQLLGFSLPNGGSLALVSLQAAKASAAFGQSTVHFTDSVYMTLGARFQKEKRRVIDSSVGVANIDGSMTGPLYSLGAPGKSDTNFSPKAVLGYKPWEDGHLYASWSRGYKSGTFNTVNVYDSPEYVKPEEVDSFELGSKLGFAEDQIQVNSAAFLNRVKNQQVQFVSLLAGGAVRLENAGEVEVKGAETELIVRPDSVQGLFISGSATYLDARYKDYANASGFDEATGLYNFGNGDNSGNRTIRTPKWSANLTVNQTFSMTHGDLEAGLVGYYSSDVFYAPSNIDASRQKPYATLDAQLSYLHLPSNIRITLLGKNLTNDRHILALFLTDAGMLEYLSPPRMLGVRLDVTFD